MSATAPAANASAGAASASAAGAGAAAPARRPAVTSQTSVLALARNIHAAVTLLPLDVANVCATFCDFGMLEAASAEDTDRYVLAHHIAKRSIQQLTVVFAEAQERGIQVRNRGGELNTLGPQTVFSNLMADGEETHVALMYTWKLPKISTIYFRHMLKIAVSGDYDDIVYVLMTFPSLKHHRTEVDRGDLLQEAFKQEKTQVMRLILDLFDPRNVDQIAVACLEQFVPTENTAMGLAFATEPALLAAICRNRGLPNAEGTELHFVSPNPGCDAYFAAINARTNPNGVNATRVRVVKGEHPRIEPGISARDAALLARLRALRTAPAAGAAAGGVAGAPPLPVKK